MTEPVDRILKGLRRIAHALSVHSKSIQEAYHITVPQLISLHELHRRGSLSLGTLTRLLYLNNSTVTGIVDRLEMRGLVRRVRKSSDRRQIHVEITEAGQAFIRNAPPPVQAHFVEQLKAVDADDIEKLLWAIDQLAEMLDSKRTDPDGDTPKSRRNS